MQLPKLISLLQTFSKDEMKSFSDYVQSPYFNKLEAPVKLYKVLQPLHPDFDNLKWEKIYKKAFPDKPAYNEPYLRNVLSDLNTLAEDFLGQQLTQQSPMLLGYAAYMLIEKKQYKVAEDMLDKMKSAKKSTPFQSTDFQMRQYCFLKMRVHERQEQRLEYSEAQQQYTDFLKKDIISAAETWYFNMIADNEGYYQYPYQLDFYERLTGIIQIQDIEFDMEMTGLHYRLLLRTEKTWYAWHNLYEFLNNNKHKISDDLLLIGNQALTDHLVQRGRIETLPDEVTDKSFLLYEEMIALRQKKGQPLTGSLFEGIVLSGSIQYGTEWGRNYIAQNKEKLPESIRTGLSVYYLARLYLADENYSEAIFIAANAEPFYHNYYFKVKWLLMRCYYETNNYDAFIGTLETFKKTLDNHPELAQKHRTAYTNDCNLLLKLFRLKQKKDVKIAIQINELLQQPDFSTFIRQFAEKEISLYLPVTA